MRQIGMVPEAHDAQRLADYLLTLGIRTRLDRADDGTAVWVYDEDQRERAAEELSQFCANPAEPRYAAAAQQAQKIEQEAEAAERRYRKNVVDLRQPWDPRRAGRRPVTLVLIGISAVVGVFSGFNPNPGDPWFNMLSITPPVVADGQVVAFQTISATLHGQLWRLITPIFLHFNLMHLLFNAFAMVALGTQVEVLRGSWRMLGMTLLIAVVSNLAQYFHAGASFGGLSGVAYGLFGYIWMKSRYEPRSGFYLDSGTVAMMLVWFVLCFTPMMGHVANMAHTAGLGVGVLIGIAPTVWRALRG